jgi:hypothetical protein
MKFLKLKIIIIPPDVLKNLSLITTDGCKLDAVEIQNEQMITLSPTFQKWILWFNPNGVAYQEMLDFFHVYSKAVGASILAFNYRYTRKQIENEFMIH